MDYCIYKLHFSTPVHFGKKALSDSEYSLCSDTVFSALCSEAINGGIDVLNDLVMKARSGCIVLSDALPYIEDDYLLPKPYIYVEHKDDIDSSVVRKAYKNLKFVSFHDYDDYLMGRFDIANAPSINELGVESLKVSASIRNDDNETRPYEIGTYAFNANCGLYIILGFERGADELIDSLMQHLSLSGIGGKRSSGYGRFTFEKTSPDKILVDKLTGDGTVSVLINTALPKEEELEESLQGAQYSMIKRSGFVSSVNYADSWQRKKDQILFKSGSCFAKVFTGDVYDVSAGAGRHPVYRYGKPMFLRIRK